MTIEPIQGNFQNILSVTHIPEWLTISRITKTIAASVVASSLPTGGPLGKQPGMTILDLFFSEASLTMMLNFMCQFGWDTRYPDVWPNVIPRDFSEGVLDEINI